MVRVLGLLTLCTPPLDPETGPPSDLQRLLCHPHLSAKLRRSSRALLEVHISAVLYGFIGPLAKAVSLSPHQIVFWRTSLAAVVLLAIARRFGDHSTIRTRKDLAYFSVIAGLLALHWVLFFQAVRVSTVAIGLVATYTYPVAMVFVESWYFDLRLRALDFVSAVAVLLGIYFLVPSFDLSDAALQGVLFGVLAGAMIPFIILTRKKRVIHHYNSWDISAYEMALAGLFLLPFMLYDGSLLNVPGSSDLVLLVVLGVVITGLGRILFVNSQRHLSGKVVGIVLALEVLYGTTLALILLGAVPSKREIIGGLIILSAASFESLRSGTPETAGRKSVGQAGRAQE